MDKIKFIKSIKKSGTSLAINIPSDIVNLVDLKEGDFLEIEIIKLKKK